MAIEEDHALSSCGLTDLGGSALYEDAISSLIHRELVFTVKSALNLGFRLIKSFRLRPLKDLVKWRYLLSERTGQRTLSGPGGKWGILIEGEGSPGF